MQLTPEQQQELARQRHENPERRRVSLPMTPGQRSEWEQAVAEEEAARPSNIARVKRMDEAATEESLSGELRRAIRDAHRPYHEMAPEIGVTPRQLLDFRAGDASLPLDAVDRLITLLGLTARLQTSEAPVEDAS